jgi:hypothetical protein
MFTMEESALLARMLRILGGAVVIAAIAAAWIVLRSR